MRFVPGMGSFPCLFKKAAYAVMNFCACNTPSNQHHSVIRGLSDPLAPAQFYVSFYVYVEEAEDLCSFWHFEAASSESLSFLV